jgi:proline iminopeptidase
VRSFYPELLAYRRGRLRVSAIHEIYYEECGNPRGKPVVILHGGPGGGISPFLRRLHNPNIYRIIVFDQRGCGQSTPHAELRENTTWHLVSDMEALRVHLNIGRWQVLGGSWGSTLALAYAQTHTERVTELILRGIFMVREREIKWFYQDGASMLFPDMWETFVAPIPVEERHDLVSAYYKRLTGEDKAEQLACAKAWSHWEASTLALRQNPEVVASFGGDKFALAFGRIECHYFINKGFFARDGQLLADAHKLRNIPGVIVQGRYDVVTPMETAWALHKAWPEARFEMIPDAGHTATEPGTTDALIRATDQFAALA